MSSGALPVIKKRKWKNWFIKKYSKCFFILDLISSGLIWFDFFFLFFSLINSLVMCRFFLCPQHNFLNRNWCQNNVFIAPFAHIYIQYTRKLNVFQIQCFLQLSPSWIFSDSQDLMKQVTAIHTCQKGHLTSKGNHSLLLLDWKRKLIDWNFPCN